jgi:hypothetical protein
MREQFIEREFRAGSRDIIDKANEIITEYQALGFTLTLRQLYYQFVSRDLIPNQQSEYKRLGSIINDARLAGLIDWAAIEDRGRSTNTHSAWDSPEAVIAAVADQYRENPWATQPRSVYVRIEKDALLGVIEPVCNRWRVPYLGCRGYTSQSEAYETGKALARDLRAGKRPLVLYLGDHDPSGLDMTRDNTDRLSMFARRGVEVRRLALNWDQVEEYDPPPNPAKESDSRAGPYIEQYGESSWELDALDPALIDTLIDAEIAAVIDRPAWEEALAAEDASRAILARAADRWDDVAEFLETQP